MRWLAFAVALLVWQSLVAATSALGRAQPPLRLLALLAAFALPARVGWR